MIDLYKDLIRKQNNHKLCRHLIFYTGVQKYEPKNTGEDRASKMAVTNGRMNLRDILREYEPMYKDTLVCVCAENSLLDEAKKNIFKYGLRHRVEEF